MLSEEAKKEVSNPIFLNPLSFMKDFAIVKQNNLFA